MRFLSILPLVFLFPACGGAVETDLIGQTSGSTDAGVVTPSDAAYKGADCDPSRCKLEVPAGFKLVVPEQSGCQAGFTQLDRVTEPAAEGACSCECNVVTQPDCSKGQIKRGLDQTNNPTCNQMATTILASGSNCTQLSQPIQTWAWHYSATLEPSGGACTYDAKVDSAKVSAKKVSFCEAPTSCLGAACGSPACVMKEGDAACPAAYPKKQLVGKKASATCAACGSCTLQAVCGGTLSFYTDQFCQQNKRDFPVDGSCNTSNINQVYYSYAFQGKVAKTACAGAPTSAATPSLDDLATVCCQK